MKAGLNGALQRAWTTLFHTFISTCIKILLEHRYNNLNRSKYSDFISEAYDLRVLLAFEKTIFNHQSQTGTLAHYFFTFFPTDVVCESFPPKNLRRGFAISRISLSEKKELKCKQNSCPKT